MTYPPNARHTVVIKANRDTLALIVCAIAVTFALSHVVRTRPATVAAVTVALPQQQDWTGRLADVAGDTTRTRPPETLTSASLVVPTAALTLPKDPSRSAQAKPRVCDLSLCVAKNTLPLPLPPVRQKPAVVEVVNIESGHKDGQSLMGRFNPLNHLPDVVRRPFDFAGNTFSGWIKRL